MAWELAFGVSSEDFILVHGVRIPFWLLESPTVFIQITEKRRELANYVRAYVKDRRGPRPASELVKAGSVEVAVHDLDIRGNVAQAEDFVR